MADLVDAGVVRYAAEITFAAIDSNGVVQERTKQFELNPGVVLYADALLAVAALSTALVGINEADIIRKRVVSIFDATTGAVGLTGNVRKEAVLTLKLAGSSKKAYHTIYAPSDQNVSGNSVVIDADMLAYLDTFEVGGDFTISDGESIPVGGVAEQIAGSRIRHVRGPKPT